jgi:EmrB/QacA subfamily drug resistance transporter
VLRLRSLRIDALLMTHLREVTVVSSIAPNPALLKLSSSSGRRVLAATILSSGAIGIDASVVNIALPFIGRDFDAPFAALQWTVVAYTLTLASFILLGGTLGDQFGRRRIFIIGIVWFGIASVACAFAPSILALIVARAVQGIGGALATPAALAIIESTFAREDRGRAVGLWAGLSGVTAAIAPFVGGWLIEAASWRWIFFINVPFVIAVALIAWKWIPPMKVVARGHIDIAGVVLAAAALGSLTFGIIEAANHSLIAATVWTPVVVAVVLFAAFILVERHSKRPMLPLAIFRSMEFSATNLATLFDYAAFGAFFLLVPTVLETVGKFTPLEAGATLLPVTAITLVLDGPSGALAQRIGARTQMVAGPLIAAVGLLLTAGIAGPFGFAGVIVGVCLFGLGLATLVSPLTSSALRSAPDNLVGLASGVNNGVARTGSLIAVAAIPIASGLTGDAYTHAARLTTGYLEAMLMCGSLLLGGAIAAAVGVPGRPARVTVSLAPKQQTEGDGQ